MKRSRGRGRRQGNSSNRNYESNGPDLKVRGNAQSIYEKYQSLAQDALSSGELITAENYLQHAEHYYRIVQANQPVRQEEDASAENGQQTITQDTVEPLVLSAAEEGTDTEATAKANGAESDTNNGEAREEKQSRRRGPLRRRRRDDNGSHGNSESADNGEVTASTDTSSEVDAIATSVTAPASDAADDEAASA
jgi:hypothetical protein